MRFKGLALTVGAAVLCFALPAFSQVKVVFQGEVDPSVQWGGDYAGIYTATVDGALTKVICDDYLDDVNPGSHWNANVLQASALNAGNINQTMFGSQIGLNGYAELAQLASWMFNGGAPAGITRADLSGIIWAITDPALTSKLTTPELSVMLSLSGLLGLNGTDAAAIAALQKFGGLNILVPDFNPVSGHNGAQEFWSVPEGGAALLFLLLAAGACFGAMRFRNGVTKVGIA